MIRGTDIPTLEQNLEGCFEAFGWWFPAGAGGRPEKYLAKIEDSLPAIRRLPRERRRTVVQAGAAVGGWPITLARHFQQVITAEPEPANWLCLGRNLDAQPEKIRSRITAHYAALGPESGAGTLLYNPKNGFGHKFRFANGPDPDQCKYTPVEGFNVISIDHMELEDVDAIFLDIEGAELPALKGAEQTLARCRPGVILLEVREHTKVHGYTPDDLTLWLKEHDYRHAGKVGKDQLYVPR